MPSTGVLFDNAIAFSWVLVSAVPLIIKAGVGHRMLGAIGLLIAVTVSVVVAVALL